MFRSLRSFLPRSAFLCTLAGGALGAGLPLACASGGGLVETRPLTADFDGYRTGAVEVEPAGLEGGAKGGQDFLAYLEAELKKGGVVEPLPIDQGAQLIVRVRAAANNSGEDDVRVSVDFIDARSRQTIGQVTVSGGASDKSGAAMRRVADDVVAYMRKNRRVPPGAKNKPGAAAAASVAPVPAGPVAGVVASGACKITCTPDSASSVVPDDQNRVAEAFQPMLKEIRVCLDRVSAQGIHPAVIVRFEGGGQLTNVRVDTGGYDEQQCVQDARSKAPPVTIGRPASLRCEYRCAK